MAPVGTSSSSRPRRRRRHPRKKLTAAAAASDRNFTVNDQPLYTHTQHRRLSNICHPPVVDEEEAAALEAFLSRTPLFVFAFLPLLLLPPVA